MEITRWSGVISSKTPRTAFLFLGGGSLEVVFWWKSQWRKAAGRENWRERHVSSMMTYICLFVCFGGNKKLKTEQTKHFGEAPWSS